MFTEEQKQALAAPLDRKHVKTRTQANRSLSYIEGWHAIAEANRIFGFDGWTREMLAIDCVNCAERKVGKDKRDGWCVTYTARVRVTVDGIVREGFGVGHGIDADLGQCHESAGKEAETDAMKRAFMTFGNQFGLALYDKTQSNVKDGLLPIEAIYTLLKTAKTEADVTKIRESKDFLDQWSHLGKGDKQDIGDWVNNNLKPSLREPA